MLADKKNIPGLLQSPFSRMLAPFLKSEYLLQTVLQHKICLNNNLVLLYREIADPKEREHKG